MPATQQQLGTYRAEQRDKHIPLGIPDIPLGAEEFNKTIATHHRRSIFQPSSLRTTGTTIGLP